MSNRPALAAARRVLTLLRYRICQPVIRGLQAVACIFETRVHLAAKRSALSRFAKLSLLESLPHSFRYRLATFGAHASYKLDEIFVFEAVRLTRRMSSLP